MDVTDCKWCGDPTYMTRTKLCDRCYNMERLINAYPTLARKILDAREASDERE